MRAVEDDAIREIVRKQEEVGLQSATDGEFRRASWHMDFIYQLDGITKEAGHIAVKFHNEQGDIEFTPAALHVDGKLGVSKTIFGDDFTFLQETVDDERPEADDPVAEHGPLPRRQGGDRPERLPRRSTRSGPTSTAAYREQVRRLGELGCTYLQFDDTSLAYMNDPHQREYIASIGGDPEHQHVEYIRHINEALADRPAGMSVTTHMCRGNFRSAWAAEGGYDFVAEALLNELEVDGFFMEWDDERSGGFEPLRFLPKGEKQVVLGLVTTKRGELETKDELKRRIEEASRYAPLEQLCLSPQCGFSSTVEGNLLSEEEQWAKLRLIVEVARGSLGPEPHRPRRDVRRLPPARADDAVLEPGLDRGAVPRRAAGRPALRARAARGPGRRARDRATRSAAASRRSSCCTRRPGLGNAVGALATARVNRAPLVVLVGQQDRRHLASSRS